MLKNTINIYKYKINNKILERDFIITAKTSIKNTNNKEIIINTNDIAIFNDFNMNIKKYFIYS